MCLAVWPEAISLLGSKELVKGKKSKDFFKLPFILFDDPFVHSRDGYEMRES